MISQMAYYVCIYPKRKQNKYNMKPANANNQLLHSDNDMEERAIERETEDIQYYYNNITDTENTINVVTGESTHLLPPPSSLLTSTDGTSNERVGSSRNSSRGTRGGVSTSNTLTASLLPVTMVCICSTVY